MSKTILKIEPNLLPRSQDFTSLAVSKTEIEIWLPFFHQLCSIDLKTLKEEINDVFEPTISKNFQVKIKNSFKLSHFEIPAFLLFQTVLDINSQKNFALRSKLLTVPNYNFDLMYKICNYFYYLAGIDFWKRGFYQNPAKIYLKMNYLDKIEKIKIYNGYVNRAL